MKPTNKSQTLSQKKYTQLLIVLVLNFVLAPFLDGNIGGLFSSAIFLCATIIIVRTFSLHQKLFRLYLGIAGLAFVLETVTRFGWYSPQGIFSLFFIQAIYAIYLGVAVLLILRDILFCQPITADTIRGGICVYFLIGFVWALLYGIVASFDPQAFSQPLIRGTSYSDESYSKVIYFSFVTLTTLGYGDIIPISPLATMLTNLEAIIGQMYPAILISILVGGYLSGRSE
ncbi:MAG: potassium channel family protein [Xenococcus sp. MO_188.B8]|nr:potassium channel family protein [Xenococcus sp. MO_188.B8]